MLTDVAAFNDFAGVFIDYRGLPARLRAEFADFVSGLADSLSAAGLRLGAVMPADDEAYDLAAIGDAADYLLLRLPANPGAFDSLDDLLRELTAQIPREKLLTRTLASNPCAGWRAAHTAKSVGMQHLPDWEMCI